MDAYYYQERKIRRFPKGLLALVSRLHIPPLRNCINILEYLWCAFFKVYKLACYMDTSLENVELYVSFL